MAKKRNKKYNPSRALEPMRKKYFRNVYLCDSSVMKHTELVNGTSIPGVKPGTVPPAIMASWARDLTDTPRHWRLMFFTFSFNSAGRPQVETVIVNPETKVIAEDIARCHRDLMQEYTDKMTADEEWGWVAVCDDGVDLEAMEPLFQENFVARGVFNKEHIENMRTFHNLNKMMETE